MRQFKATTFGQTSMVVVLVVNGHAVLSLSSGVDNYSETDYMLRNKSSAQIFPTTSSIISQLVLERCVNNENE